MYLVPWATAALERTEKEPGAGDSGSVRLREIVAFVKPVETAISSSGSGARVIKSTAASTLFWTVSLILNFCLNVKFYKLLMEFRFVGRNFDAKIFFYVLLNFYI